MSRCWLPVWAIASGCSIGVQTFQGHHSAQQLTLSPSDADVAATLGSTPITGTADVSSRRTELDFGYLLHEQGFVWDVGATLGLSAAYLTKPTGMLAAAPPNPRDQDFYDAYFTSVTMPVAAVYDGEVQLGVYAKAGFTGIARIARETGGPNYHFEAGLEVNMPFVKNGVGFLRVGIAYEAAEIQVASPDALYDVGSTSYVGLTAAVGARVGKR